MQITTDTTGRSYQTTRLASQRGGVLTFTKETRQSFENALNFCINLPPEGFPDLHLLASEQDGQVIFTYLSKGTILAELPGEKNLLFAIPADLKSVSRMTGQARPTVASVEAAGHYDAILKTMERASRDERGGLVPATRETARHYAFRCVRALAERGYTAAHASDEAGQWFRSEGEAGCYVAQDSLHVPNLHGGQDWLFSFSEIAHEQKQGVVGDPERVPTSEKDARLYAKARVREWLARGNEVERDGMAAGLMCKLDCYADYRIGEGRIYVENERDKELSSGQGWSYDLTELETELIREGKGMGIAVEADIRRRNGTNEMQAAQAASTHPKTHAVYRIREDGGYDFAAAFPAAREGEDDPARRYAAELGRLGKNVTLVPMQDPSQARASLTSMGMAALMQAGWYDMDTEDFGPRASLRAESDEDLREFLVSDGTHSDWIVSANAQDAAREFASDYTAAALDSKWPLTVHDDDGALVGTFEAQGDTNGRARISLSPSFGEAPAATVAQSRGR